MNIVESHPTVSVPVSGGTLIIKPTDEEKLMNSLKSLLDGEIKKLQSEIDELKKTTVPKLGSKTKYVSSANLQSECNSKGFYTVPYSGWLYIYNMAGRGGGSIKIWLNPNDSNYDSNGRFNPDSTHGLVFIRNYANTGQEADDVMLPVHKDDKLFVFPGGSSGWLPGLSQTHLGNAVWPYFYLHYD